jgi:hypothetical protein
VCVLVFRAHMSFRLPPISRSSLMSVALFAAGALSVAGYGYITRDADTGATPAAQSHSRAVTAPKVQTGESTVPPTSLTAGEARGEETRSDGVAADGAPARNAQAASGASSGDTKAAAVTPQAVAIWIAQATGADDARRGAAIDALASAPKADAVPVLAQVLETANESDRPRVLRSLRTLAQQQGDEDDRIRAVVRKVASHASDENAVQTAQATLQDIEQDLSQASAAVRR